MVMFNTFNIIIWTIDYIIVESWHSGDVNFFWGVPRRRCALLL